MSEQIFSDAQSKVETFQTTEQLVEYVRQLEFKVREQDEQLHRNANVMMNQTEHIIWMKQVILNLSNSKRR